jgi:tRNA-splicing ligase RtcB
MPIEFIVDVRLDIFRAVAKSRQSKCPMIDACQQIVSKAPGANGLTQIAVCSCDQLEIALRLFVRTHGAGRTMSRTEARRRFSVDDHVAATAGVECRKDEAVIDETPAAYKDIDAVMHAQRDLVEIVHTLKQVVCVKG